MPKWGDLLAHIAVEKPDVIAVTATWSNSDHLITEFTIAGCESYLKTDSTKNWSPPPPPLPI